MYKLGLEAKILVLHAIRGDTIWKLHNLQHSCIKISIFTCMSVTILAVQAILERKVSKLIYNCSWLRVRSEHLLQHFVFCKCELQQCYKLRV